MSEHEQLSELCARLGADATQAMTMAAQLQKRATQLAAERSVTREEAMSYLIETVIRGRHGEAPDAVKASRLPPSMREKMVSQFHALYHRAPAVVARAPGRIEFIGNHTDYNQGTVLGAAIDRGIWVAAAPNDAGVRRFASGQHPGMVELSVPDGVRRQSGASEWINYPLGVLTALPEFSLRAPEGFDLLVLSDLPTGAGLSSSAALELASALAFLRLTGQEAEMETVIKVGRRAENNFVGIPCGILDQGVSGFGKKDHLVFIDCRGPDFSNVPIPSSARFWICNTHTKHALVDGAYAARHRECMEAATALGVGSLREVSPELLSTQMGSLDTVSGKRARHVVEEIARVESSVVALRRGDLEEVGRLLTASHRSSQHLFENSTEELDFLVDALLEQPGVYGARLSGGGFGGAVMALTTADFGDREAGVVVEGYAKKYGAAPDVLRTRADDGAAVVA